MDTGEQGAAVTAVGADLCKQELLKRAGVEALKRYREWRARANDAKEHAEQYAKVIKFVENFTHRYLYELTSAQIRYVSRRSQHALDNIRPREAIKEVESFTTPVAYQHLFHYYVERRLCIPTWQEFDAWLKGPAAGRWLEPLKKKTGYHEAHQSRRDQLDRAYQWRAGKAYYSAFREAELLARLRTEYGLPVRYHVLADVLWGVDLWLGDGLVRVYLPDEKYSKRKPHPRKYFAGPGSPFSILDVEVKRQGGGNFWLVDDGSVERTANFLESCSRGS